MNSQEFLALWTPFEPVVGLWGVAGSYKHLVSNSTAVGEVHFPTNIAHEICLHRLTLAVLEKGYTLSKEGFWSPGSTWGPHHDFPDFESVLFAAADHAGLRAKAPEAKPAMPWGIMVDEAAGVITLHGVRYVREAKP